MEFFFFCYIYCCNSFLMFSITYKATILSFSYCNVFTTFSVTTHNKGIIPAIAAFFVVEIRHDSYYIWTNIRSTVLEGSGKKIKIERWFGKEIFGQKRYICATLLLTYKRTLFLIVYKTNNSVLCFFISLLSYRWAIIFFFLLFSFINLYFRYVI